MGMGTKIMGVTQDMKAAQILAQELIPYDPSRIKRYEPMFAGVQAQLIDVRPIEWTIEEQQQLAAYLFTQLRPFHFLVKPAVAEGDVTGKLYPMTIAGLEPGVWVDEAKVAQIRALLRERAGRPVGTLLADIRQRQERLGLGGVGAPAADSLDLSPAFPLSAQEPPLAPLYEDDDDLSSFRESRAAKRRRKLLTRTTDDERPSLRLTSRDLEIIRAVYEYRALTTPQVHALLFANPAGSQRVTMVQCQHRLKLLYHHGYLYRDEQPTKLSEGRQPLVYFLDKAGAQLLAGYWHLEVGELDWRPRDNASGVGYLFLDHLLKTNDVRITLVRAAAQAGCIIETWLDDKRLRSRQMRDYVLLASTQKKEQRVAIVPDGYFCLTCGQSQIHHFLEIDLRTTIGRSSRDDTRDWARKIQGYIVYHKHGQYERRYHAQSFRVLTVTTGARRLANLKAITEQVGGRSRFWFTTFTDLQTDPDSVAADLANRRPGRAVRLFVFRLTTASMSCCAFSMYEKSRGKCGVVLRPRSLLASLLILPHGGKGQDEQRTAFAAAALASVWLCHALDRSAFGRTGNRKSKCCVMYQTLSLLASLPIVSHGQGSDDEQRAAPCGSLPLTTCVCLWTKASTVACHEYIERRQYGHNHGRHGPSH